MRPWFRRLNTKDKHTLYLQESYFRPGDTILTYPRFKWRPNTVKTLKPFFRSFFNQGIGKTSSYAFCWPNCQHLLLESLLNLPRPWKQFLFIFPPQKINATKKILSLTSHMIEGLRLSLKNRPGNTSFTSKYLSITVVSIQKKDIHHSYRLDAHRSSFIIPDLNKVLSKMNDSNVLFLEVR